MHWFKIVLVVLLAVGILATVISAGEEKKSSPRGDAFTVAMNGFLLAGVLMWL